MSCCPPAKNFPNSRSMLIFEKWKKAKTWIGEKFLVLCCPCIVCPWIVWVTSARKRKTPTIGIVATITFVASFLVSSVCTTNLTVILYLQTNLIGRVVRCPAFSVIVLVRVVIGQVECEIGNYALQKSTKLKLSVKVAPAVDDWTANIWIMWSADY